MRITASTLAHLRGERFSTGFRAEFLGEDSDGEYVSRLDILEALCTGKRVIHVGCVDHNPEVIERKRARGKWLHAILTDAAARCLGVDVSEDSIRYLHGIGYDNAIQADITRPPAAILDEQWDFIVIPEVLEHVGDPVAFLKGIRSALTGRAAAIVITVPNAFALENFRHARRGREAINSDHRFWFTPYTLSKVVTDAGFTIESLHLCKGGRIHRHSLLRNAYFRRRPMLRNNILMRATF